MKLTKAFLKEAVLLSAVLLLLFPSFSLAEIKEIISEGTYNMGDGETPTVAESRALLQAKRTAVEEAGTYVESYSKTKNFQLTADEIQVLASGIMEVEVLEKKRTVVGDGINFWIKIKARVSTDKMEEMAKRVKEKSVVEDYKKIQEAYDKSQKDIEELKRQLAGAKGDKEKKKIEAKITDTGNLFQAFEWYEKGNKYSLNNELEQAINAYSRSLEFGIKITEAYYSRGIAYGNKGDFDSAIRDFDTAIELFIPFKDGKDDKAIPTDVKTEMTIKHASVYYNRGLAYAKKGQLKKALDDLNNAITINPSDEMAYYMLYSTRAMDYSEAAQYDKAIEEYSKAIKLKPDEHAVLYLNRGASYNDVGQYDLAIEDYKKAVAIEPNVGNAAYLLFGIAYIRKGEYSMAIENLDKAITLNPNNAEAYFHRGLAYAKKTRQSYGNEIQLYLDQVIADYANACNLGHKKGCEALAILRNGYDRNR